MRIRMLPIRRRPMALRPGVRHVGNLRVRWSMVPDVLPESKGPANARPMTHDSSQHSAKLSMNPHVKVLLVFPSSAVTMAISRLPVD
jgi:hypothetical protein